VLPVVIMAVSRRRSAAAIACWWSSSCRWVSMARRRSQLGSSRALADLGERQSGPAQEADAVEALHVVIVIDAVARRGCDVTG
jgi:uncharacterized protein YjiS (DUF1127 family)